MPSPVTTTRLLQDLAQRMQCQDLPFEGGHVRWRCLGEGPPLVLLHGGHGAWTHWARNMDALSRRFRVCVPDLPGYGDSSTPSAASLDALLDATQQTLDVLVGAQTPILLAGFSFGGLVAARLAGRREHVESLALLAPAGHGGVRRPKGELRSWRAAQATQDEVALRSIMRHNLETHMLAGPADEQAVLIHTEACLATRFHSKSLSRGGGLGEHLRALRCPVLLLWGEHDVTATPLEDAPRMAAHCLHARAHVVQDAGHWVQYEAADQVNALLSDWFAGPVPDTGH